MARSLPENTVDAWTSIALASQGASWIWLPTTNEGGTLTGHHPGDVSSIIGRRLVLVENKGIEAWTKHPFGSDGGAQRAFLRNVEEAGLNLLSSQGVSTLPPLGWVFYGLPLDATADGYRWRDFSSWHFLLCPHDADAQHLGKTSAELSKVGKAVFAKERTRHDVHGCPLDDVVAPPMRLDWLSSATSIGLAGLPIPSKPSSALSLLSNLAFTAQSLGADFLDPDHLQGFDPEPQPETLPDALRVLGNAVGRGAPHLTVTML